MSIFKEIPPTAGFPINLKDIFFSFKREKSDFRESLQKYLNTSVRITCSGTAALYIILKALKQISSKKKVIIPAYICPLVPLAVKRAGLEVKICDIEKNNFNFKKDNFASLCKEDILAVIAVHLAGIPVDLTYIKEVIKEKNIFLIEDAAQSLGAFYRQMPTGTIGDFGFYSFCRGKGVTIYEGGAIAVNNPNHIPLIDSTINKFVTEDFIQEAIKIIEVFGYALFYRPQLFWFVFNLPQKFWKLMGKEYKALIEDFDTNFPLHKVSSWRKRVGKPLLHRLEKEVFSQRQKAKYLIERLQKIQGIEVIQENFQDKANYPYLTIVFNDTKKRSAFLDLSKNSGLGISQIYAEAITDYPYLEGFIKKFPAENAKNMAKREVTISMSKFLKNKDLDQLITLIKKALKK